MRLPILSCSSALAFEQARFGDDFSAALQATLQAGNAIGVEILKDFTELGPWPEAPSILVLCGKGGNCADALLAAAKIRRSIPAARIELAAPAGLRSLREMPREVLRRHGTYFPAVPVPLEAGADRSWDLVIDGLHGMQYRPPLTESAAAWIRLLNRHPRVGVRASIDLPSGLTDACPAHPDSVFRADFTYATGCVKSPVVQPHAADFTGRLRAIDLGFFPETPCPPDGCSGWFALPETIAPLRSLRSQSLHKRSAGRVFILAGSRTFPGAALLAAQGALHGGAGLVEVAVPESLHASFSASLPEAIWTPLPETPDGAVALESAGQCLACIQRADCLLIGPGLSQNRETQALIEHLVVRCTTPRILDADALHPVPVRAALSAGHPVLLTPHPGELLRIAAALPQTTPDFLALLRKGALTRYHRGDGMPVFLTHGGAVLSRGGHGDILAGLCSAVLAARLAAGETPGLAFDQGVPESVTWAGLAAESLARTNGQLAAPTTCILGHLAKVLRERHLTEPA
jgi:NAD(P)H-hydrate epimerase